MRLTKLFAAVACATTVLTLQTTVAGSAAPATAKAKNGNIMFSGRDTIFPGFHVWQVALRAPIDSRISTWIDTPESDVSGPFGAYWARYSPDGTKAAYQRQHDIVIRDVASGTVLRRLEGDGPKAGAGLDWSPDGTQLVVLSQKDIQVLDLATETFTPVYHAEFFKRLSEVSWSPDGKWIAFTTSNDIDNTIRAVHPDGTGRHTIVSQSQSAGAFDSIEWSPDSRRLAYIHTHYDLATAARTTELMTIDKKGESAVDLSALAGPPEAGHWFTDLAWSPDGKKIAAIDFYQSAPGVDVGRVRGYAVDGSSSSWLTALQRIDEAGTVDWGTKLP